MPCCATLLGGTSLGGNFLPGASLEHSGAAAGVTGLLLAKMQAVQLESPRSRSPDRQPLSQHSLETAAVLSTASNACRRFVGWVFANNFEVVVFDMDLTMGSGHCGDGLLRGDAVEKYIAAASPDFVEAIKVLHRLPGIRLAVATNSDPKEYELPGQSRDTHLLGPDLARELIGRWCPEALPHFEVMVGFDPTLHPGVPPLPGKSVHMRQISDHYKVSFDNMVLIDDVPRCLENNDGWHGILVNSQRRGFRFDDCFAVQRL